MKRKLLLDISLKFYFPVFAVPVVFREKKMPQRCRWTLIRTEKKSLDVSVSASFRSRSGFPCRKYDIFAYLHDR